MSDSHGTKSGNLTTLGDGAAPFWRSVYASFICHWDITGDKSNLRNGAPRTPLAVVVGYALNVLVLATIVTTYFLAYDFLYSGVFSGDLPGLRSGILCRLEYENYMRVVNPSPQADDPTKSECNIYSVSQFIGFQDFEIQRVSENMKLPKSISNKAVVDSAPITRLTRWAGNIITALFLLSLVYYCAGKRLVIPTPRTSYCDSSELKGKKDTDPNCEEAWCKYKGRRRDSYRGLMIAFACFLLIFSATVGFFFLIGALTKWSWWLLLMPISSLIALSFAEFLVWRLDGQWRFEAGFHGMLRILFETHGHFFPLVGIFFTFLGLGIAMSDKKLLDIIGQIQGNAAGAVDPKEWTTLLCGIGVAVFASLHGTLTTIWSRAAAGYFEGDREDYSSPDQEPELHRSAPAGASSGVGNSGARASVEDRAPGAVAKPSELNSRTCETSCHGTSSGPHAKLGTQLNDISEEVRSLVLSVAEISELLKPIAIASLQLPPLQRRGRIFMHETRRRLAVIMKREPDFAAVQSKLDALLQRLNEGPIDLLVSMNDAVKNSIANTRRLIEDAGKALGERGGNIVSQGANLEKVTERLVETIRALEESLAKQPLPEARSEGADQEFVADVRKRLDEIVELMTRPRSARSKSRKPEG